MAKFEEYKEAEDLVGMDMTRKFAGLPRFEMEEERRADLNCQQMQMGYTRARRYANHKGEPVCALAKTSTLTLDSAGGKKYSTVDGKKTLIPRLDIADQEPDKVKAAEIFAAQLAILNADKTYIRLREKHKLEHESRELDLSGIDVVKGVPEKRGGEAKGEVGKRNKKAVKKK